MLKLIKKLKYNIVILAETKLDDTFQTNQFIMNNFKKPYRLDNTKASGGLLVYILKSLASKRLESFQIPENTQIIPFEIILKNNKWLILAVYSPNKNVGRIFLYNLSNVLDFYLQNLSNVVIIGDMNLQTNETIMFDFMNKYNLISLITKSTCFKSLNGTNIDLILTNKNFFL